MTIVRKSLKNIKVSRADYARAARIRDDDIDLSDIPELSDEDFRNARKRTAGSRASRETLRFEVYRDTSGQFRWRLNAPDGEILAVSPRGYTSKAACQKAIVQVRSSQMPAEIQA